MKYEENLSHNQRQTLYLVAHRVTRVTKHAIDDFELASAQFNITRVLYKKTSGTAQFRLPLDLRGLEMSRRCPLPTL